MLIGESQQGITHIGFLEQLMSLLYNFNKNLR